MRYTVIVRTDRAVVELDGSVSIVERGEGRNRRGRDAAWVGESTSVDVDGFEDAAVTTKENGGIDGVIG